MMFPLHISSKKFPNCFICQKRLKGKERRGREGRIQARSFLLSGSGGSGEILGLRHTTNITSLRLPLEVILSLFWQKFVCFLSIFIELFGCLFHSPPFSLSRPSEHVVETLRKNSRSPTNHSKNNTIIPPPENPNKTLGPA